MDLVAASLGIVVLTIAGLLLAMIGAPPPPCER